MWLRDCGALIVDGRGRFRVRQVGFALVEIVAPEGLRRAVAGPRA